MKDTFEIAKIIHRYLLGDISEEEQVLLDEWVGHSARHRQMLQEFLRAGYLDEKMIRHQIFNARRGLGKFEERKRREKRRARWVRVASVAAVFCCLISASVILWVNSSNREANSVGSTPIVPGGYKAVLVLNDGQQVELSRETMMKVKDQSTVITVADNHIVYPKGDTIKSVGINRVITPRGGEYSLELSDGTKVWLNAESELHYPVKFGNHAREVEIVGEAYFEVAKDTCRPFIVNARGMKTRVLGTSFNVRAYPGEARRTTLVEGSVKVSYNNQQVYIQPGQQVVLERERLEVQQVDVQVYMGWKNGLFVFEEQKLAEVLRELERWYDVHVFIANEEVQQLKFTSNFPRYADIERVLDIIELAACVKCEVKGRTIIVEADN